MVILLILIIVVLIIFLDRAFHIVQNLENKQKRSELIFSVYQNQMAWLKEHKECGHWINNLEGPLGPNYEKYDFDQYMGFFGTLYCLKLRDLIDKELMYDLFGETLMSVYEANNYELKHIIMERRKEGKLHDHYEGVEILYKDVKQLNNIKTSSASKITPFKFKKTVGPNKASLTLDYPVFSLDRELMLPAGTILSHDDLLALVSSNTANYQKKYSLMQFGTVKKDVLDFVRESAGNTIFSNDQEIAEVIKLMENVQLSQPKLDSIGYFKQCDIYTYRHILMVFAYLTLLSRDLVLNYRTRIVEMATSPLHDFGKICVPVEILQKVSPLTRDERKNLEHHTVAGYILQCYYSQNVDHLAARVARDHHERNNGSGYPRGIRLNDRMVEIVAVCDVYDALTSPRSYRPVPFDNRSAIENITLMAERNEVSWEVVQALVAHNRKGKPRFAECRVSIEKRGIIPLGNAYGILTD